MKSRPSFQREFSGKTRNLSLLGLLTLVLLAGGIGKGCAARRAASPYLVAGGIGKGSAASRAASPYLVPGNSRSGLAAFSSKGCKVCHSLPGEPRKLGPMLGGLPGRPFTEADIAASLWNHAPSMSQKMAELSLEPPLFTTTEMADLFAFLYYLSVLDPVGSTNRGRWFFLEKGCYTCHAMALNESQKAGPALPYWSAHTSPIRLAQAMWNHATKMQSQMNSSDMPWVKLEKSDMADIVAYVSLVNKIAVDKEFFVGDQVRGRDLFTARGCADCHGVRRGEAKAGPSLEEMNGAARRIGELSALMWNHFPTMSVLLGDASSRQLQLNVDEMADLFAYLFSVGYFAETGDPTRGRAVFVSKKCSTCHEERGSAGTHVHQLHGRISLIDLATALWNHGPQMMATIRSAGLDWPELTHDQIVDLGAYLGTRD